MEMVVELTDELREHYNGHLGPPDYKGKTVLDIGADVGTTAQFFLEKGANVVIAVEGYKAAFDRLVENALMFPMVVLKDSHTNGETKQVIVEAMLYIESSDDFSYLLSKWDWADIVKVDIEGSEFYLAGVPDEIFRLPNEYVIDFHSQTIEKILKEKLIRNGFTLYKEGYCNVIYAKNNNPSTRIRL